MKQKKMKRPESRNWLVFMTGWLAGYSIAWIVLFFMIETFELTGNKLINFAIVGFTLGTVTSLTQYVMIRWKFGINFTWWLPVSLMAWLFGAMVPFRYLENSSGSGDTIEMLLVSLALYLPPALAQMFLIHKYTKQAWLWVLAHLTGSALFGMFYHVFSDSNVSFVIGYIVFGSVTALTLMWLLEILQSPQKRKNS